MKNLLFVSTATLVLSSCGVFDWTSNKSKEWGNSMPVANEQKRCVNTWFCGSENSGGAAQQQYMQSAPQSQAAPIAPVEDESVRRSKYYNPAYPSTYQPETQGLPSSSQIAPQSYNNNAAPMNAAQTYASMQQQQGAVPVSYAPPPPVAPMGYANAPVQQYTAPMQANYVPAMPVAQQPLMPAQAQQAIAGAPPGAIIPAGLELSGAPSSEGGMIGNPGMGSQALLNEASRDPRLQGFEASPDWMNKKEDE